MGQVKIHLTAVSVFSAFVADNVKCTVTGGVLFLIEGEMQTGAPKSDLSTGTINEPGDTGD
jgi:hypothetical protein